MTDNAKPAKKRAKKPDPAPEPASPIATFPAWYKDIKFASGERAQTIITLAVENRHDEAIIPLIATKDLMLEVTIREATP